MKKFVIGIFVVLIFLIAGALALPSLVPSSVYKDKIQTQLTKELQRDVMIEGDVKLSVFPTIRARTEKVTISNPDGYSAQNFASMDSLEARVKLLPLFSKRVEISSFELIRPMINLEKRSDGSANWEFGDSDTEQAPTETGPFKRDGRYKNIDPAIGKFAIENGAITYVDAVSNQAYDLKDANLAFSLPSLSKPVSIDGDVIFNGEPVDLKLRLDTPRAFLDGQSTPVTFDIKTSFTDMAGDGAFLQSEDIAFELDLNGEVSDLSKMAGFLPELDFPVIQLANRIKLAGTYRYDGQVMTIKNADIGLGGPLLDMIFKGNAQLADKPVLDGNIDLDVRDLPAIAKITGQDIQGIDVAKTLNLKADFNAQDTGFAAQNITAKVTGDGLAGTFTGAGTFGDSLVANGSFDADIASVPGLVTRLSMDLPQAAALGTLSTKGQLDLNDKTVTLRNLQANTQGEYLTGSFTGQGQFTDSLSLDGSFDAQSPSVPALANAAKIEAPQAAALGNFDTSGTLQMQGEQLTLNLTKAETKGDALNASYVGTIDKIGDALSLNGEFTSLVPSAQKVASLTGMNIPYADVIGEMRANGKISGPADALSFDGVSAELSKGQLNGSFNGSAALRNGFTLDGNLAADIPSSRSLAARSGTDLPPSTAAGEIYENVSISGAVTGNPAEIKFSNADLVMDAINGKGDFTMDLRQGKPNVVGNLQLGSLDLKPYMAAYTAQRPNAGIQPWSETPINFNALRAIDGTFNISTPEILMTRLNMGKTDFTATIRDGVLVAKLPQINMYGGLGTLTASLDASQAVPAFAMDVKLDDIRSNTFLGAVANYTSLTGEGHTLLEVKGQGHSQADIMRSLEGVGDFKVLNGELAGIDLGQFMTGIDSALTSRVIPSGIGKTYKTKFNDIVGLFNIKNGVVSIDNFNLKALDASASGKGQLDLGNQTIDFSFRPRLTGSAASDLASFGIPLRMKGSFNNLSTGLDSELLGQIAAQRAKAELGRTLQEQVGGGLGDVLGGVLGTPKNPVAEPAPTDPATSETPAEPTPVQTPQAEPTPTQPEDVVTDLLGGILGVEKAQDPVSEDEAQTEETETKAEEKEPTLEDALGSLFGKKKAND